MVATLSILHYNVCFFGNMQLCRVNCTNKIEFTHSSHDGVLILLLNMSPSAARYLHKLMA